MFATLHDAAGKANPRASSTDHWDNDSPSGLPFRGMWGVCSMQALTHTWHLHMAQEGACHTQSMHVRSRQHGPLGASTATVYACLLAVNVYREYMHAAPKPTEHARDRPQAKHVSLTARAIAHMLKKLPWYIACLVQYTNPVHCVQLPWFVVRWRAMVNYGGLAADASTFLLRRLLMEVPTALSTSLSLSPPLLKWCHRVPTWWRNPPGCQGPQGKCRC